MTSINIIYFGSNNFSAKVLSNLVKHTNINIKYVVTKLDKKEGGGGQLKENSVAFTAKQYNIPVIQVTSLLKNPTQLSTIDFSTIDLGVVVSFAYIIPYDILRQVEKGFVNLHPSLLPKYRGPSPIVSSISNGDIQLGITIMLLDEGMDTGPILASCKLQNTSNLIYPQLEEIIIEQGTKLLLETIEKYMQNRITPQAQNNSKASITKYITKEDGFMTLDEKPLGIYNNFRAFYNWPGIYTKVENLEKFLGYKLKIKDKSTIIKLKEVALDDKGFLAILKVQLPNKPVISFRDFENGYK